jgi:hypothetical protein
MSRTPIATVVLVFGIGALAIPASAPVIDKVTDANELAAVLSLRTITTAQVNYNVTCGNGGYAPTLVVLHTPPRGSSDRFIDASLGSSLKPEKSGFTFSVTAGAGSAKGPMDCNGTQTVTKFYASAVPVTPKTGTKSFAVNENNITWTMKGSKAPPEPFGPPAQQITIK